MLNIKGFFLSLAVSAYAFNAYAEPPELSWVGCDISNKAYATALAKAYQNKTGVRINVESGDDARGIREVASGDADLGGSCRYMLPDDPVQIGVGLEPVAWGALVVITHPDNPVVNISVEHLKAIYSGKVQDWSKLGGPSNQKIEVYTRDNRVSGIGHTTRKLLFNNEKQKLASSKSFTSSSLLETAVAENPNAIGITGISSARTLENVKILKLEGVEPTVGNIHSGEYSLYRPMYLTYNPNSPNIEEVRKFIRFVHSKGGRDVMRNNGVVPYREALSLVMKQVQVDQAALSKASEKIY